MSASPKQTDHQSLVSVVADPHTVDKVICSERKQRVLKQILDAGLLQDQAALGAFIDCNGVEQNVRNLRSAFPPHFRHAFAAKANSMLEVLKLLRELGLECEVASPGELEQARRAGFESDTIVYDEPAKSTKLLSAILGSGVSLNLDNFQEFNAVKVILSDTQTKSKIGFRINPQVGAGKITAMSTATLTSKFGVALDENRQQLVDAYRSHSWLTTIHTHVGSQGCTLELMREGILKVVQLAEDINNSLGHQQITLIDIGGGLPVNFGCEAVAPTFSSYAESLRSDVPVLFSGRYQVKTEFGRSLLAKHGFVVARVVYTKESGGRRIAICPAGTQLATRTTLMPDMWPIRISVFSHDGELKTGPGVCHDVAGPCCFAGDLIARQQQLPLIEPGDLVMMHDTGAYYFSNPYYYNALPAPAVFGFRTNASNQLQLDTWRAAQSIDDVLSIIG